MTKSILARKRKMFSKGPLVLVMVSIVGLAISLGGYLNYLLKEQEMPADTLSMVDQETVKELQESEALLRDKLTEFIEERETFDSQITGLQSTINQLKGEKEIIVKQVRSSVSSFEEYRQRATEESQAYTEMIQKLEEEKNQLLSQLEQTDRRYVEEVSSLNEKIGEYEVDIDQLSEELQRKERSKIIRETAKLHYNLGNFYFRQQDYLAAKKEYEKALSYKDDADTRYNLAVLFDDYLDGDKEALMHYEKYLMMKPKSKDFATIEQRVLDLRAQRAVLSKEGPGRWIVKDLK